VFRVVPKAGRWPWKLESAQGVCNNSPAESHRPENGWRSSSWFIKY